MCQNSPFNKITLATIQLNYSKGDFLFMRALTHPLIY